MVDVFFAIAKSPCTIKSFKTRTSLHDIFLAWTQSYSDNFPINSPNDNCYFRIFTCRVPCFFSLCIKTLPISAFGAASRKHSLQSDFNPVGLKVGTMLFSEIGPIPRFQGGRLAHISQNDGLRPNSTRIFANLQISPKKVDFGKHTFQSRCSHLLGVQISCNFVQIRANSCNFDVLGVQILCNFVQWLACGFCGDVLGVQTSCNFVACGFRSDVLGVQISCKFVAPWACGSWSKVLANLLACKFRGNSQPQWRANNAAKFAQSSGMRSFAKLHTISRIFVQFACARTCSEKISKNRLYQFCS